MSQETDPLVTCLDGLARAGNRANVSTVSRLAKLDRNVVGRTLLMCHSFRMVDFVNEGRSEVFSATMTGRLFRSLVHGEYEVVVNSLQTILESLSAMPEAIEAKINPMEMAYRHNIRWPGSIREETYREYIRELQKTFVTVQATPAQRGATGLRQARLKSIQEILEEIDEIVFALQLAGDKLGANTPERRLLSEVRQLLSRSDAVIPHLIGGEIRSVIPKASLVLAISEAINLFQTAADIRGLAKELELEEVKFEKVSTDGKGRPIFRVK